MTERQFKILDAFGAVLVGVFFAALTVLAIVAFISDLIFPGMR